MATLRDTFDTIDPLPTDSLDGWSLPAWTYSDPDFAKNSRRETSIDLDDMMEIANAAPVRKLLTDRLPGVDLDESNVMGAIDAEGRLSVLGRADDMLKVGGIWVSPFEIESALTAHPAVCEAAVVGHADEAGLIKPRAFVVLKDPAAAGPALAAELKVWVKERLAPYKYPRWIEFVPELPKTATGKTQRFRLRGGAAP